MSHTRTRIPTRTRTAVATAVAAVAVLLFPHSAPAATGPDDRAAGVPVEIWAAVQRDLGVDHATDLRGQAERMIRTEQRLRSTLADTFGGAWVASDGQALVVATTDPAAADHIRAAGAEPRLVRHSEQELDSIKTRLDRNGTAASSVTGWYVDVASNSVVVEALPGARQAAEQFIDRSGVVGAPIRIETAAGAPQPLAYPLREGDPFFVGVGRCTIGFLVKIFGSADGYLTAGHCGSPGAQTFGFNMELQGIFLVAAFPGTDIGLVAVNDDWEPTPFIRGQLEAPVGAAVCKKGSTSGTTCGVITGKNMTVHYPQGIVFGLTRTSLCSEPGDSGAPAFTPGSLQGQGMVSGGSGNCAIGGVTFIQPLRPALAAYGLTLITK